MSTAREIELKAAEELPKLAELAMQFDKIMRDVMREALSYGTLMVLGREVCARRARRLRKRGEHLMYVGRTKTGKTRYRWIRRIVPWAIRNEHDLQTD